ncbi:MAG: hypothetical protein ABI723_14985 [Bacteroidia bacterium]
MTKTQKRPTLLSIVCIIGYVGIAISFPNIFSPFIKQLGIGYPALLGSIISLRFISLVGVWFMKKWGVILFVIIFIVNEIVRTMIDDVSYIELPVSAILSIVFLCYYRLMDRNL